MVLRRPSSQLVASFQPSAASFLSQMKYLSAPRTRGQSGAGRARCCLTYACKPLLLGVNCLQL